MKHEEARETLLKMAFAESTEFAEDRLFAFGYSDEHKALMLAIEALEKQIPKKPIEDTQYVGWLIWNCPRCGKEVGRVLEPLQHHCECGQAIDWGDESEEYEAYQDEMGEGMARMLEARNQGRMGK